MDDNPANRFVLKDMLVAIGFEVEMAIDGHEAIDKAIENQPDLILLDLIMPGLDGFETIKRIRQLPVIQNVVAIAVSADTFENARQDSAAAGCNDFISKPVQISALLECIGSHLELDWIYEEAEETEPEDEPLPLIAPPEDELQNLLKLSGTGSITNIGKWVARIRSNDRKCIPFAVRVDQLADNFEFKRIQDFIKPFLKGKEE